MILKEGVDLRLEDIHYTPLILKNKLMFIDLSKSKQHR